MVKKRNRIFIRLEKDGRYIQRKISSRMLCALFDLQYMIDDAWDTIRLNKMDKEIVNFFSIIEHFDDADHGNQLGYQQSARYHIGKDKAIQLKNKLIWRKKKGREFGTFGRPKWKRIK